LIVLRPFLPESPAWQEMKRAGTLKRPSFAELFRPAYRRTTLVAALMVACSYGAALGALQHLPRIVPGLPELQGLERPHVEKAVSGVQFYQEIGGMLGRLTLAMLAVTMITRRGLIRAFLVPGLVIIPLVFLFPATNDLALLRWGVLIAGLLTVGQLSFWGNYLPRMYPTHLRGTGESFAANVGGRLVGTFAAVVTTQLATQMPGSTQFTKLAYAAASTAFLVYAISLVASFWLPEPAREQLPE
jgi:hypothetical protein